MWGLIIFQPAGDVDFGEVGTDEVDAVVVDAVLLTVDCLKRISLRWKMEVSI